MSSQYTHKLTHSHSNLGTVTSAWWPTVICVAFSFAYSQSVTHDWGQTNTLNKALEFIASLSGPLHSKNKPTDKISHVYWWYGRQININWNMISCAWNTRWFEGGIFLAFVFVHTVHVFVWIDIQHWQVSGTLFNIFISLTIFLSNSHCIIYVWVHSWISSFSILSKSWSM